MTDEPHPLDDLLSADLDGETTPAEHARIESDERLRSRREELRSASKLAGHPPPPLATAEADRIIGRAADAFGTDVDDAADPSTSPLPSPTPLSRPRPRQTRWLVAAAIVLLAAIGIGLIATDRSPDRQSNTASRAAEGRTESKSATPRSETGAPSSTTARSKSLQTGTPDSSPTIGFLGRFASPGALRSALQTRGPTAVPEPAPEARITVGQADRCATVIEAKDPGLKRSNRRSAVAAFLGAEPVLVFEYRTRAISGNRTTTRVVATGVAACDERLNFER
jgi:hypothetical protein